MGLNEWEKGQNNGNKGKFSQKINDKLRKTFWKFALFFQYHAMDSLHKNAYLLDKAIASLVPSSGPVLCRDEMEEWSASEANLFEEALDKYGKDFTDIRQDFVSFISSAFPKVLFCINFPKKELSRIIK